MARRPPIRGSSGASAACRDAHCRCGEVAEWLKAPHSKCGILARVSWVQIPPSPPYKKYRLEPNAYEVAKQADFSIIRDVLIERCGA